VKYVAIALGTVFAIFVLRAMLFRTLDRRLHGRRASPTMPMGMRARARAVLAWPVFIVAVVAATALGVFIGSLIGPN
jgi:hypothetical protein